MRRSIESADAHIDKSTEAAMDSWDVLKRAQDAVRGSIGAGVSDTNR